MRQLNNATWKAVILARGLGTRMRRIDSAADLTRDQASMADSGVKGMIPVGRPFMDYLLSALADAGFTEACLVIGPEHASVRAHYEGLSTHRIQIGYAIQPEPRGTADAVAAAEPFVGGDGFLVINSDNYYPPAALHAARLLDGAGLVAFSAHAIVQDGGVPPERVATFPGIEISRDGVLARLAPSHQNGYVSMNCWRFSPVIFQACRSITPSARGELELPDAVAYSIDRLGERYQVLRSEAAVLDLSSRADIARVTRQLVGVAVRL